VNERSDRKSEAATTRLGLMQRLPLLVGSVLAIGLLMLAVVLDRQRTDTPPVKVEFVDSNGVPDEIAEGEKYVATFQLEWEGPVSMRDGSVSVFASRRGDTTEDAPEDGWPIVCESEFDDIVYVQRVICPFIAPGPGQFALLLEVRNVAEEVIGEGLFTHLVLDPATTTVPADSED
jgi:hypothetical protein